MIRRVASAASDALLRHRGSLPASVVWVEPEPYRRGRAFVDDVEVEQTDAIVLADGEIPALRAALGRAVGPPSPLLARLDAYRRHGLASDDAPLIELDSGGEGGRQPEPVLAERDRRGISLPPLLNRLLHYLAVETGPAVCLELGTAHGVSTVHLLAGLDHGNLVTVEVDPTRRALALEGIDALMPGASVTSVEGHFPDCLPELLVSLSGPVDLAFEDGPHEPDVTLGTFEAVRERMRPGGHYVVDDIYLRENGQAWEAIRSHESVATWAEVNARVGVCVVG